MPKNTDIKSILIIGAMLMSVELGYAQTVNLAIAKEKIEPSDQQSNDEAEFSQSDLDAILIACDLKTENAKAILRDGTLDIMIDTSVKPEKLSCVTQKLKATQVVLRTITVRIADEHLNSDNANEDIY